MIFSMRGIWNTIRWAKTECEERSRWPRSKIAVGDDWHAVTSNVHRLLSPLLLIWVALAVTLTIRVAAAATDVWFSPLDPVWRKIHRWQANDFMQLFMPDSPWKIAARGIKAFELFKKFAEQGTDADLQLIIRDLARRRIDLAVSATPLIASQACGIGVESYGPPHDMAALAARVKRLGGSIAFVVLDEPLYFGHQFNGRPMRAYETYPQTACHAPIADLARQAATKMAELHSVFPEAKVGEVEPIGPPPANSANDLADWLAAYQAASGAPFAFVDLDIVWPQPSWPIQFDAAVAAIQKAGIPLGVIYNGSATDQSDSAWIGSAKAHIQIIESKLRTKPDRAIFQSWSEHPQQILPETAPDTFTGLVKLYVDRN
jgi:hypothetical protein